jgi:hypothetical protein
VVGQGSMDRSPVFGPEYQFDYILGEATITDAAVEHFKDANWPNLKVLDLCTTAIIFSKESSDSGGSGPPSEVQLQKDKRSHPTYAMFNVRRQQDSRKGDQRYGYCRLGSALRSGYQYMLTLMVGWNSFSEGDKQNLKDFGKSFPKMRKLYI